MAMKTKLPFAQIAMSGADFENPRTEVDKKKIVELAKSIVQHDLIYPLGVWRTKDEAGEQLSVVVDGGRRFRAIDLILNHPGSVVDKEITKKMVAARAKALTAGTPVRIVLAKSLVDARCVALTLNLQRVDLTSYEVTKEMVALRESGMAQKDIATKINKSATWVSRKLSAWKNAAPELKDAWRDGKLPDDDVESLSKLKAGKQPDHTEQVRRLSKLMAHRDTDTTAPSRTDRAKARKIAKGDAASKIKRPAPDKIASFAKITAAATKTEPYVQGMHDAFRFMLGEIGAGEFDEAYAKFAANNDFLTSDKPATKKKAPKKAAKRARA